MLDLSDLPKVEREHKRSITPQSVSKELGDEITRLVQRGVANADISEQLKLSLKTVEYYRFIKRI